jgi:hypothetical protein
MNFDTNDIEDDPCFGCDLACPGCPFEEIEEPEIRAKKKIEGSDKYEIFKKQ